MTVKPTNRDPPKPPDGGWGWVVVIGSNFTLQLVLIVHSAGVFFNDWKEYFGASATAVAAVGSAHMAAFLFMGPLGGYLCHRIGPRKLALLGGVIAFVSLSVASQAKSLIVLILSFGVLTGMGMGFGFVSVTDIVGKYFKKRFAIANSASNSGSAIGVIVLPILARFLIDLYNWNGALLVLAAISGNVCVCAMLFRPVRRISRKGLTKKCVVRCEEQRDPPGGRNRLEAEAERKTLLLQHEMLCHENLQHADGKPYMKMSATYECDSDAKEDGQNLKRIPHGKPHRKVSICSGHDAEAEGVDQNLKGVSDGKPYRRFSTSSGHDSAPEEESKNLEGVSDGKPYRRFSTSPGHDSAPEEESKNLEGVSDGKPYRRFSTSSGHDSAPEEESKHLEGVSDGKPYRRFSTGSGHDSAPEEESKNLEGVSDGKPYRRFSTSSGHDSGAEEESKNLEGVSDGKPHGRFSTSSGHDSAPEEESKNLEGVSDGKPYRRFSTSSGHDSGAEEESKNLEGVSDGKPYRRFSTSCTSDFEPVSNGETTNLTGAPASGSQSDVVDSNPVTNSTDIKFKRRRLTKGSIYLGHFVRGSGFYVMKTSHRFNLLCLMQITLGLSFTSTIMYLVPCAIDAGVSKLDAAFLLSISGIGGLFGRLTSGPLVDFKILGAVKLYFVLTSACGICIVTIPIIKTYTGFAVFSVMFGFTSGMYKSLQVVLIRMFLGADRIATGIGIFMPHVGIGNVIGPMFAGWLYDVRGQYDMAFYICGGIMIVTSFLVLLMPYLERIEKRHRLHTENEDEPESVLPFGSVLSLAAV